MGCVLSVVSGSIYPPPPPEAEINFDVQITRADYFVLTGRVVDCATGEAIPGAFLRFTLCSGTFQTVLGHTFSGCDGSYMFPVNRSLIIPNSNIQIQAVCTEPAPTPCSGNP